MSEIFELRTSEKPLKEGLITHLKSKLNVTTCNAYLTSNRFVICPKPIAFLGLLSYFFKSKKISHQIDISNIVSIGVEKHGLGNKTVIRTKGEQIDVAFMAGRDKWHQTIVDAIKDANPSIKSKQIGDLIEFSK